MIRPSFSGQQPERMLSDPNPVLYRELRRKPTYMVVFAGILVASFLVKTGQDGQRVDYFRADKAWWYITLLTIGYMIARGLAKSGSREPYDDDRR
jgi:hypothetical protein